MASTLIECKATNDKNKVSNANWVNTFSNPIEIRKNDVVNLKIGFIQENSPNFSTINIEKDLTGTIKFGYYVSNWNTGDPTLNDDMYYNPFNHFQPNDPVAPNDTLPHVTNLGSYGDYIAWKWRKADGKAFQYGTAPGDECVPLIDEVTLSIASGQYSGDELAQLVNDQLAQLNLKTGGSSRFFSDKNNILRSSIPDAYSDRTYPYHFWRINGEDNDTPDFENDYGFVYSQHGALITAVAANTNQDLLSDDIGYFFGASQIALKFNNQNKFEWQYLHSPIFNNSTGSPQMSNAILNLFNAGNFLYLDAKVVDATHTQITSALTPGEKLLLINGTTVYIILTGGTSIAVTLNANVSDSGVLTYPVSGDPNYPLDGTVCHIRVEENPVNPLNHWRKVSRNSGIYLSELTSAFVDGSGDASFWELLGFKPSEITVPYSDINNPKQSELDRASTTQYIGLSVLTSKTGQMKIDSNQPPVIGTPLYTSADANSTLAIVADDYQQTKNDGGYYTIECNSNFKPCNFENDISIKHSVLSICSKQWSSSNYISDFAQGGMIYEHLSNEPILLSSINIRILDHNGNLAGNLGDGSSFFLQIQRGATS